jgi:antirestriction protein ArdC
MSALSQNFAAPIWMTYRQACEFNAHVRKGEKGSLVVYANAITRTERNEKTGEDVERVGKHTILVDYFDYHLPLDGAICRDLVVRKCHNNLKCYR